MNKIDVLCNDASCDKEHYESWSTITDTETGESVSARFHTVEVADVSEEQDELAVSELYNKIISINK